MLSVASRLDRSRFAPSICVLQGGGALEQEARALGVPVIEARFLIPGRPYATLPARVWQAAQPFKPGRFDLWHSYHYLDDYTEPLIARIAGAKAWIYTKKNMSWNRRSWLARSWLATRIAAQNTAMLRQFFRRQPLNAKACLLPPGVDAQRFAPGQPPSLNLRSKLGLSSHDFLLGCVAHLIPRKNQEMLIRALEYAPEIHLVLAGHSPDAAYSARLASLAGQAGVSGRVHITGSLGNIPALHAELDAFALTAYHEGCPVALLEAMSSGLPCLVTDVPGSQDVIEHGRSGLVVPVDDAPALAEAIRRLIDAPELRRQLGTNARQRILEHYTIEHETAQYEALYAEALRL